MFFADRLVAVTLFAGLVLLAIGCGGSNNKGKIEGRWRFASTAEPALRDALLVFGDDGTITLTRPDTPKPVVWRYKLLASNAADFYDLPPDLPTQFGLSPGSSALRVTIGITVVPGEWFEDREMTLTDPTGRVLRLTRLRE